MHGALDQGDWSVCISSGKQLITAAPTAAWLKDQYGQSDQCEMAHVKTVYAYVFHMQPVSPIRIGAPKGIWVINSHWILSLLSRALYTGMRTREGTCRPPGQSNVQSLGPSTGHAWKTASQATQAQRSMFFNHLRRKIIIILWNNSYFSHLMPSHSDPTWDWH